MFLGCRIFRIECHQLSTSIIDQARAGAGFARPKSSTCRLVSQIQHEANISLTALGLLCIYIIQRKNRMFDSHPRLGAPGVGRNLCEYLCVIFKFHPLLALLLGTRTGHSLAAGFGFLRKGSYGSDPALWIFSCEARSEQLCLVWHLFGLVDVDGRSFIEQNHVDS